MCRLSVCVCGLSLFLAFAFPSLAQETRPAAETVRDWDRYISLTERRIGSELNNTSAFLRSDFNLLKTKKLFIRQLSTKDENGKDIEVKGGAIHHWLGAVYVPGKDMETLLRWVQDYDEHQHYFKDVEQSTLRKHNGDSYEVFLRLTRSKFGVTARFNTEHRIVYGRHGNGRSSSRSVATRIAQVDRSGKEYPPGRDDGYLWRLNSYWRFIERDGGVIVECETIGLSRPLGSFLGFLDFFAFGRIKKIAESVAREAIEDTLTSIRDGILGGPRKSS